MFQYSHVPSPSHVLVPIPSLPAASWLSPPPPHHMCWSLLYLPSLQLVVPSPSPSHVLVPIIPSLPAAGCPLPLPITCAGPYYTFPPCSWLSPPPPLHMCWSLLYLPSLQLAVPSPSPSHVLVPIIPSLPAAGCPLPLTITCACPYYTFPPCSWLPPPPPHHMCWSLLYLPSLQLAVPSPLHYMCWSLLYLPSLQLAVPSPSPSHVLVPIIPSLPAAGCPLPLPIACAGPYYTFPLCSWLSPPLSITCASPYYTFPLCSWLSPPPPHHMCWSLLYIPSLQLAVPSPSPSHVLVPITLSLPAAGCPSPLPPMDGPIIPFPATNEGRLCITVIQGSSLRVM